MLLLEANKIPYFFENVDVFKNENRKPEFLHISPTGLVPAIQETDGFTLTESSAILMYLVESKHLPWYGAADSLKAKAYVNFWLSWNGGNTRLGTRQMLHNKLFPKLLNSEQNYQLGQKNFTKAVKFMDGTLSKTKFLAGSKPTIADLMIVPEIDQHMEEAFNLFDYKGFPQVTRWVKDVRKAVGEDVYDKVYAPVKEAALIRNLKR
jgi:glutathione S-transferase